MHYAAQHGQTNILTRLLSRGVNVNGPCKYGTLTPLAVACAILSPLDVAANIGQLEAIRILLDHNADPNLMSCRLFTSLSVSIKAGLPQSLRCVEILLEDGADPDGGSYGVTPLVIATHKGLTEIIRRLVQAGADPDVTNCWKLKSKEKFQEAKVKGAEAFKEQDYYKALYWYSQANDIAPYDANVLSNRSMCWARVKDGKSALETASKCILLRPDLPKAYYWAGVAYNLLKGSC